MRAIRRADTKPEVGLRRLLHSWGLRFRKDLRLDLAGGRARPDIAFTKEKVAVFVDSCFWHVCPEHGHLPKSNEWYWVPKLLRNVERDRAQDELLRQSGWVVVRVWEHEGLEAGGHRVVRELQRRGEASGCLDGSGKDHG